VGEESLAPQVCCDESSIRLTAGVSEGRGEAGDDGG